MILLFVLLTIVAATSANPSRGAATTAPTSEPTFSSPTGMCNVNLVIGGKKLIVSKEYLAVHSPVLSAMFVAKKKGDIEIKDVDSAEFVSLLQVLFPGRDKITDTTVLPIVKLGHKFQMKRILDLAEQHLISSAALDTVDKLRHADTYCLDSLRDHCLLSYHSVMRMGNLKSTSEYANFSDRMKAAICDRMMVLVETRKCMW